MPPAAWPGEGGYPAAPGQGWGSPAGPPSAGPPPMELSTATPRPPLLLLIIGLVIPAATLLLALVDNWLLHLTGWLVAIAGGFGMLVAFTTTDLRRRANPWYLSRPGLVSGLRLAVVVVTLLAAALNAYFVADHIARLDVWAAA